MRISVSVSPFTEQILRTGIEFTDGNRTAKTVDDLQRLFKAHGANEVYARIATRRVFGRSWGLGHDHGAERGLRRARLAKSLGVPFNPEIGLFGVYGDVGGQPPPDFRDYPQIHLPGEWSSLTVDQMVPILRAYGALVAREIVGTGATVRIWDIGNEVEFGMAGVAVRPLSREGYVEPGGKADWYRPPGRVDPAIGRMSVVQLLQMPEKERIAWLQAHLWPHLARMLAAVAAGIRSVDPHARFSTHVSGVTSVLPEQAVAFYKAVRDGGFLPDELGFSFYPTSSASPADRLKAFHETAVRVRRELGRPVFIAEFGYPSGRLEGPFRWNDAVPGYPQTPEGQAAFTRDLVEWGARTGVLSGLRPWAPDLVAVGWEPMSLFERRGTKAVAKSALDAIAEGLRRARP